MQHPLIVFDVNETLLDLTSMESFFDRVLGDRLLLRLWFANLILYSEALSLANCYVAFGDIAAATLRMLASSRGINVTDADETELKERIATLPAHPEVAGALRRLTSAGFRLFTLTDNPASVQERQRKSAGIDQFFERCFSVENVRRHKPAPETYGFVQKALGQSPSQFLMVACHTWDTLGAVAAGWRAALIARPGNALLAVGPQPTFVANDLNEVADQLIERF